MKAKQIRVSRNVKFFADKMMQKFDLAPFGNTKLPVVMYGIYNADDYAFYQEHKPGIILLWRGTDAKILNAEKVEKINSKTNVRHISGSHAVNKSLLKHGIKSEIIPITPTKGDIKMAPSGKFVYCYICSENEKMSSKYRLDWLKKLSKELPYTFIFTTQKKYTQEKLRSVYAKCFVGVRLLGHDGLSNSIIEMGLMGRKTISNSSLPHTIKWKTYEDVHAAIIREYKLRDKNIKEVSKAYHELINISDQWLESV